MLRFAVGVLLLTAAAPLETEVVAPDSSGASRFDATSGNPAVDCFPDEGGGTVRHRVGVDRYQRKAVRGAIEFFEGGLHEAALAQVDGVFGGEQPLSHRQPA